MNAKLNQTTSIWMQTGEIPVHAALAADIEADVCVVGAGIAGMTTAYLLLKEGRSVVVLDDGPIGGGQTERTTAHITNAIDDRYVAIEDWHGSEGARLAAESHSAAIDRIEAIVARENIACDFERLDVISSLLRASLQTSWSRNSMPRDEQGCHTLNSYHVVRWPRSTPARVCDSLAKGSFILGSILPD